ncbi:hypothetical protein BST17_21755 [Mycolicibacterium bacteremicum]|uniref:CopC domain-containing protein n=1 Tax=Mycolicibacterium bacteremicum TaxID=564198 RepID=A0A1W9YRQ4_MYCBA|nr:hypothetical protein BST17_21755 [Mycolicibacterium bacteremicum]
MLARRRHLPAPSTDRTHVTATARLIAASLLALALWASGSGIATAHTALIESDPADGSSLTVAPTTITLTFNEDINSTFANVVVNDSGGRNWVSGTPVVTGSTLQATIGPDPLISGMYTVGYRVLSADGHPVSGSYTFTVQPGPSQPSQPAASTADAAPVTSSATPAQPPAPANDTSGTSAAILWAAVAGLAAGAVITVLQARRRRREAHALSQPGSTADAPALDDRDQST